MAIETAFDLVTDVAADTDGKLDEQALRSHRFRGGEPIVMADGQTWYFPRPAIEYRPKLSAGRVRSSNPTTDLGTEFDAALERMDGDHGEENSGGSFITSMFDLAVAMLRHSYDLTDSDLESLLVFRIGDEANQETWNAIVGTARGTYAPKVSTATSGSAS